MVSLNIPFVCFWQNPQKTVQKPNWLKWRVAERRGGTPHGVCMSLFDVPACLLLTLNHRCELQIEFFALCLLSAWRIKATTFLPSTASSRVQTPGRIRLGRISPWPQTDHFNPPDPPSIHRQTLSSAPFVLRPEVGEHMRYCRVSVLIGTLISVLNSQLSFFLNPLLWVISLYFIDTEKNIKSRDEAKQQNWNKIHQLMSVACLKNWPLARVLNKTWPSNNLKLLDVTWNQLPNFLNVTVDICIDFWRNIFFSVLPHTQAGASWDRTLFFVFNVTLGGGNWNQRSRCKQTRSRL